jgi:hypothetical protein
MRATLSIPFFIPRRMNLQGLRGIWVDPNLKNAKSQIGRAPTKTDQ